MLQSLNVEAEFRGADAAVSALELKSAALLSVSRQPSDFLAADVFAFKAGSAALSEQLAVPYPTRSAIVTPFGQPAAVVAAAVPTTRATLPLVADIFMLRFVASALGSAAPFVAPPASLSRKY